MITHAHKLSVKLFLAAPVDPEAVVPALHGWIQLQSVPDHLLVDVADYSHVDAGPGVVLVANEANFYVDDFAGEPGLTYQRKQPVDGSFADRLRQALAEAVTAAERLEQDPLLEGKVKFRTDLLSLKIVDRLRAPNSDATLETLRPELEAVFGSQATFARIGGERDLFEVRIRTAAATGLGSLPGATTA